MRQSLFVEDFFRRSSRKFHNSDSLFYLHRIQLRTFQHDLNLFFCSNDSINAIKIQEELLSLIRIAFDRYPAYRTLMHEKCINRRFLCGLRPEICRRRGFTFLANYFHGKCNHQHSRNQKNDRIWSFYQVHRSGGQENIRISSPCWLFIHASPVGYAQGEYDQGGIFDNAYQSVVTDAIPPLSLTVG